MDKGKKPIQEEEYILSLLDYYQTNEIVTPLAPPEYSVLSQGSGSAKETPLADEMEGAGEDFFSKFLSMNFTEPTNMELYSNVPSSNSAVMPTAQADNDQLLQLPPKASVRSRAPAPSNAIAFRKTMPPHELDKLALLDPKRAKRIITNRLSALRAKEKKKLYIFTLEHKLHTLQTKSTKMSARLAILQTESNSLKAENNILKDRMDGIVQQIRLHDSLNDQIRSEIQHIRTMLRPFSANGSSENINLPINAPLAAHQLEYDFQQSCLGKNNFGVQNKPGELANINSYSNSIHSRVIYQVKSEALRTTATTLL